MATTSNTPQPVPAKRVPDLHPLLAHIRKGDDIEVWWPRDQQYYRGVVHARLPDRKWRVAYNDGTQEDLDLSREQWRFVGNAMASFLAIVGVRPGSVTSSDRATRTGTAANNAETERTLSPVHMDPVLEERRQHISKLPLLHAHVRVGDRVEVWWPDDQEFYTGAVHASLPGGKWRILYDDGEREDLDLLREKWRFIGDARQSFMTAVGVRLVRDMQPTGGSSGSTTRNGVVVSRANGVGAHSRETKNGA